MICITCNKEIKPGQPYESWTYPNDGRYVCSPCVLVGINRLMDAMANVPEHIRLCECDQEYDFEEEPFHG